ncbi:MAG: hypothetical protein H7A21_11210 [Spirochaetales bacterium]|nr:hypothetical protein [Leptospiraceae bacterium]MCP5481994.1 hypothetical protein [Spirochaetales bacterium]MCP5486475.1 hypothetical protein [Spirochaetales bacterium]
MIQFQWERISDDRSRISVRTPVTAVGTLHKLATAMYVLGLDIVSGNVLSERIEGEEISQDNFVLHVPGQSGPISLNESLARLGQLMETLLQRDFSADRLLQDYNVEAPAPERLFEIAPRIRLEAVPGGHMSRLDLIAADRRGLVYHLTRVIAELDINITSAVILTTSNGMAEDTFYLQHDGTALSASLSATLISGFRGETASATPQG